MAIDYERYYEPKPAEGGWDGERSDAWHQLGAVLKADHVVELLDRAQRAQDRRPSVLEVGCGSGEVLAELGRRGFGPELVGVEVSKTAAEMARGKPGVTDVAVFDGGRLPFGDGAFTLVLATHVLEHVSDPAALLAEMARVSSGLVVVEVPLEDNLSARRPHARALSRHVGHVQRFSRADVHRLIAGAGLNRLTEMRDALPRRVLAFHDGRTRGTLKWIVRSGVSGLPFGDRLVTTHFAALAQKPRARR
jgi:SAM-dependent methyltransferase